MQWDLGAWEEDIRRASERIAPFVERSPVVRSWRMSRQLGYPVWWKCDQFQASGAFKMRGAANALLSRPEAERVQGAITYSTGNHGLAVAYICRDLGIPAVICVSKLVPNAKVEALRRSGARVMVEGESQDEAKKVAERLADEEGLILIPPFDDSAVIAGQGTLGREILEQVPEVKTVLVPLSGGGLAAGVALALKARNQGIRVVGISMDQGAAMYESLRLGAPREVQEVRSLADSLQGGIGLDNRWTFPLVQTFLDEVVLVSEAAIRDAMRWLMEEGLMVEGAAAVGPAWLLASPRPSLEGPIVGILTGRNLAVEDFFLAVGGEKVE